MSTKDAIRWAERQMAWEDLKERKRAQLWQPPELDDFLQNLPNFPEIDMLVFQKQCEISKRGLLYRFEGNYSFALWLPAEAAPTEHIEASMLENLRSRVGQALETKNLQVFTLTDELVSWKLFRGQKFEIWQITIHVC